MGPAAVIIELVALNDPTVAVIVAVPAERAVRVFPDTETIVGALLVKVATLP
jgi:hypothetical protein